MISSYSGLPVRLSARATDEAGRVRTRSWALNAAFTLAHLAPLALFWTGIAWRDLALAGVLYVVRMFFVTAGYHRYFSHRTYRLNRVMQFLMAVGGSTALQKGVLWWAAHHRHHHKHSDQPGDVHSPHHGLWWSHVGWIVSATTEQTHYERIRDFARYPELVWLNKYHLVPPALLAFACWWFGGWSGLFGGFFLSTVLLWHGTFSINSLAHLWGTRPYVTSDTSRNNLLLALITLGEGWHNNHHHYQSSARQGFLWWQIDLSYYLLRAMCAVGLAGDLREPPYRVLRPGVGRMVRTPAEPAQPPPQSV